MSQYSSKLRLRWGFACKQCSGALVVLKTRHYLSKQDGYLHIPHRDDSKCKLPECCAIHHGMGLPENKRKIKKTNKKTIHSSADDIKHQKQQCTLPVGIYRDWERFWKCLAWSVLDWPLDQHETNLYLKIKQLLVTKEHEKQRSLTEKRSNKIAWKRKIKIALYEVKEAIPAIVQGEKQSLNNGKLKKRNA